MAKQPSRVGNDIVDLREPSALLKSQDLRFIERVFTPAEQARIRSAAKPSNELWRLWTAKESAFKIYRKLDPAVIFRHRGFAVEQATVHCGDFKCAVEWRETPDYIHALARWPIEAGERVIAGIQLLEATESPPGTLSALELKSVYGEASRQVRLLAKEILARDFSLRETEIVREILSATGYFEPPRLTCGRADVSLSHDGRYVAAAAILWSSAAIS